MNFARSPNPQVLACQIAEQILDTQGLLVIPEVERLIRDLEQEHYVILSSDYPQEQVIDHILLVLQELLTDWECGEQIKKIRAPYQAPVLDRLIRESLHLSAQDPIGDRQSRLASLSALLCPLRQNIGSCFATAPAILIQSQYPVRLLRDLQELIGTESLGRVLNGVEYRVPIAIHVKVSPGEHPLLKAWEFTLASFAEVQADISRWNLYISLGCNSRDPDGIGELVYNQAQEQLGLFQAEEVALASRYDHTFAQVKMLESRLRRAESEQDVRWMHMEYRQKLQEIDDVATEQQRLYQKSKQFTTTINQFQDHILKSFPHHFQEVYDAELERDRGGLYDDAPAGFRLLYKHGRTQPSNWTFIHDVTEYRDALRQYFLSLERELISMPENQSLEKEYGALFTAILLLIQEDRFLVASLHRLSQAYREPLPDHPLEHVHQLARTPWAYCSGGTMSTLVRAYFCLSEAPREQHTWVESPTELLVFYIDSLKMLSLEPRDGLKQVGDQRSLLAYSPTHAFSIKPYWEPFRKGWASTFYTYSWVRDEWIAPQQQFWESLWIPPPILEHLVIDILRDIPQERRLPIEEEIRPLITQRLKSFELRTLMLGLQNLSSWPESMRQRFADLIDKTLYEQLPFVSIEEGYRRNQEIWHLFDWKGVAPACSPHGIPGWLSASQYRVQLESQMARYLGRATSSGHERLEALHFATQSGWRAPLPILFADPNWLGKALGFVVNPGNLELELWLCERHGLTGIPLSVWKRYLDGTEHKEWGLYIDSTQYAHH